MYVNPAARGRLVLKMEPLSGSDSGVRGIEGVVAIAVREHIG